VKTIQGEGGPYAELEGLEVLAESDKAVKVHVDGEDEEPWLPRSQVDLDLGERKLVLPMWLYEEKFGG
jgi:hypothetical protein